MDKYDLLTDLEENCEYSAASLKNMDTKELVDARLRYEGFIGYTDSILEWVAPYFHENPTTEDMDNTLQEAIFKLLFEDGLTEQEILNQVKEYLS